jgi:hypothetical protein
MNGKTNEGNTIPGRRNRTVVNTGHFRIAIEKIRDRLSVRVTATQR